MGLKKLLQDLTQLQNTRTPTITNALNNGLDILGDSIPGAGGNSIFNSAGFTNNYGESNGGILDDGTAYINYPGLSNPIIFKQRSMPWPDSYEEGKPLLTRRNFDTNAFEDMEQGSPEANPEATNFGRGDGDLKTFRRLDDFRRIGKWIFGTGEGRGWIIKQAGLQLMNPRLDAPQKDLLTSITEGLTNIFDFSGNAPKDPNQMTYNGGVNTLVSTLMAGAGAIDREGAVPFVHSGYIDAIGKKTWGMAGSLGQSDYDYNSEEESEGNDTNRLTFLLTNKIDGNLKMGFVRDLGLEGTGLGNFINSVGDFINDNLGFLGLGGEGEELFSYAGGPGTKYGIGRTSIRRYVDSTKDNYGDGFIKTTSKNPFSIFNKGQAAVNFLQNTHTQGGIKIKGETTQHPYFQYGTIIEDGSGNRTYHRESRIGVGSPGKIIAPTEGRAWNQNGDGTINYKAFVADKVDKVNALDLHTNKNGVFTDNAYRDFIRFRFEAIDNNTPSTASHQHSKVILFRAFLEDISDNFNAEHNNFKYNGRGEEFYTYKSFKRTIDVSFKIAAQSRHEMMPLYRKLNYLVSNTAPDYSSNGRIRTPYMRMTVGSWMNRIPGVISSVSCKWGTDYPWEIAMDSPEDDNPHMLVLPHILDVGVSFIPIHNFLPAKGVDTPFILPNHTGIDGALKDNQKWLEEGAELDINRAKEFLQSPTVDRLSDGSFN